MPDPERGPMQETGAGSAVMQEMGALLVTSGFISGLAALVAGPTGAKDAAWVLAVAALLFLLNGAVLWRTGLPTERSDQHG